MKTTRKRRTLFNAFHGLLLSSVAALPQLSHAAICSFGPGTPGEDSLQTVMGNLLGSGAPTVTTDCLADSQDSYWQTSNAAKKGVTGTTTLIVEIAGYANQNTFGIYDASDPAHLLQVYSGANDPFDKRTIVFSDNGSGYNVAIKRNNTTLASGIFGSQDFGFYMSTPQDSGYTYFSDTALNTADNVDHMYAYQGNGNYFLDTGNVPASLRNKEFHSEMYLLAWEDLLNGGDGDYQDMMVATEFITPIPIPPAFALLGFSLPALLLPGLRSRRYCRDNPEVLSGRFSCA